MHTTRKKKRSLLANTYRYGMATYFTADPSTHSMFNFHLYTKLFLNENNEVRTFFLTTTAQTECITPSPASAHSRNGRSGSILATVSGQTQAKVRVLSFHDKGQLFEAWHGEWFLIPAKTTVGRTITPPVAAVQHQIAGFTSRHSHDVRLQATTSTFCTLPPLELTIQTLS